MSDTARASQTRIRRPARASGLGLVLGAGLLVALTRWWGLSLERHGTVILLAHGEPLMGPVAVRINAVTVGLVLFAAAAIVWSPVCAARLRWRPLLAAAALVGLAWSVALASVDGIHRGFTARLTGRDEYLHDLPLVGDNFLHVFSGGIQGHDSLQWTTHVAGHPPGALLTFWALDQLGFSGPGAAAAFCVFAGALAIPAVLVTVRSLAGEHLARQTAPFVALLPAAVWIAVSADAWFLCVSAWGIALLALASARRDAVGHLQALGGGLLLGSALFLSYGLVLLAPLAVVAARRRISVLLLGAVGVAAVVVAFRAGGFWWLDGLAQTRARVASGDAGNRPYAYFVVANIAALAIAVGPATVAALPRIRQQSAVRLLAGGALLGVAIADITGLSRGEVERIWLPFMPWLAVATALLPVRGRRWWLAAQLIVAISVQTTVVSLW